MYMFPSEVYPYQISKIQGPTKIYIRPNESVAGAHTCCRLYASPAAIVKLGVT